LLLVGYSNAQSFNFVSIDVPCASCPGGIATTLAYGINPGGDIVGTYSDSQGQHGFLLSGGQFRTLDVPGSLVGASGTLPTQARGISPAGDIVGSFIAPVSAAPANSPAYCPNVTSTYCIKGFLYTRVTGKFSLGAIPRPRGRDRATHNFNRKHFPGPSGPLQTNIWDINPAGDFVGIYIGSDGFRHGFLQLAGAPAPVSIDYPGAIHTRAYGINPGGAIVGQWIDTNGLKHGFLAVPAGND